MAQPRDKFCVVCGRGGTGVGQLGEDGRCPRCYRRTLADEPAVAGTDLSAMFAEYRAHTESRRQTACPKCGEPIKVGHALIVCTARPKRRKPAHPA